MIRNNEIKIIIIACVLTAAIVCIFTISKGLIKFSKEDKYVSQVEESRMIDTYQNTELTYNEIRSLVKK